MTRLAIEIMTTTADCFQRDGARVFNVAVHEVAKHFIARLADLMDGNVLTCEVNVIFECMNNDA